MSSKKTPTKNNKNTFKCQHCDHVSPSKGGLNKHNNAIHNGITSKIGQKGETGYAITPQKEAFCQLYASDREFFGNGVQSYIEAFEVQIYQGKRPKGAGNWMTYESVRTTVYRLLQNVDILKRINEIFEAGGLNDAHADKQLEFLMTQKAELRTSLGAVQEYNKLKKRTTDRVDHVVAFADVKNMSDEDLAREREKLTKFFNKTD